MFYKSKEIVSNDRTFNVKFRPDAGGQMCEVKIYELTKPARKFFRYKHRLNIWFYVEEFETIEAGLRKMVREYLKREYNQEMIAKKWRNA